MIYAKPKEGEMSELAAEIKIAKSAKWYRRLKIIQQSTIGRSVISLAAEFDLSPATVRKYITAFNQGGIDALRPKKQPGRPPKVGHLSRDQWEEILAQTPNQYDKLETDSRVWTLELLARYAYYYLKQQVCFQTIWAALRRCEFRTGRSKLRVGSPDPDYTIKRERVETFESLPPRGN